MNQSTPLSRLCRLSEVCDSKDIRPLTAALFPGAHCPLMGAMMAVGGIEDAAMLVLGANECAYYTKSATINGFSFGGIDNRCFSVVIDEQDVTFGCREKLSAAFAELAEEVSPKAVFLVTTCVLEITGDDIDAIAAELEGRFKIPVLPVHTEHFKTANHLPGVRDTISACLPLIRPCRPEERRKNRINVIGQRLGKFYDTELYRILTARGIEIGMMLPGGTSLEQIREAASAKVNLVVNELGLPFAQEMEKRFGTPFVLFSKFVDPERILGACQELFSSLGLAMDGEMEQLYQEAAALTANAKNELNGITYIYGNTALDCMEFNAFMTELGMEPLLIQTNEILETEEAFRRKILTRFDPYVTKTANIAPLQAVYDVLKPNLYLGHEYASRLRAKGIELVHSDSISSMLGFEVTGAVVRELVRASKEARQLAEKGSA